MLVAGDAGGQDLWDDGVGDDGEAEVDGAGGGGVFFIGDDLVFGDVGSGRFLRCLPA